MRHLRSFAPLLLSLVALAAPALAQSDEALTSDALMRAAALDEIFTTMGESIAAAPEQESLPFPAQLADNWEPSAMEVFAADEMHAELALVLDDGLSPEERAELGRFFLGAFGVKVTEIERAVALLGPEAQIAAVDHGRTLVAEATPERVARIEEMLELVSAEISNVMVAQSVRGMMIGMSIAGQRGDIVVPWDEIEASLDAMMPAMMADLAETQRAITHFAYQDLTEAELDEYLAFLRTDAARKFYAVAAVGVGSIVTDRMTRFGEALVRRMNAVRT